MPSSHNLSLFVNFLGKQRDFSGKQRVHIGVLVDVPYFFRTVRARRNALPQDENEKV